MKVGEEMEASKIDENKKLVIIFIKIYNKLTNFQLLK
jgi:hypothetical protein